jgi:hypothetical protein
MDAESDSVEFIESDREKEVSELDAGELADLRECAADGDEEAIAALREAGRWPETGTLETGAGTASKSKEKAEAPWRKLTEKDLLPRDPKLKSSVWDHGRCVVVLLVYLPRL